MPKLLDLKDEEIWRDTSFDYENESFGAEWLLSGIELDIDGLAKKNIKSEKGGKKNIELKKLESHITKKRVLKNIFPDLQASKKLSRNEKLK